MANNHNNLGDFKIDVNNKEMIQKLAHYIIDEMKKHEGMTIKDAIGLSDEGMEEIYALAYNFHNQGNYNEAIALFEFLAGTSPRTYKFLLGLASSYHQIGSYENAIAGFILALNQDAENPLPAYYAADCCLKLNWNDEALELLQSTMEMCGERLEYSTLKARCDLIVKSLNNRN